MEAKGAAHSEQLVYGPADVATRLGVSSAGLRRLAAVYERVYGELARDPRHGRVWPQEAVERLERARGMVRAGQAVSVEAALNSLAFGEPGADDPEPTALARAPEEQDRDHALGAVVGELRALRWAVEEQNRRLHALEEENRQLRASLPPPGAGPVPPWWERAVRLSQPLRQFPSGVVGRVASGGRDTPLGSLWVRGRSLLASTIRRKR
jgi:hypothetical protein